MDTYTTGHHHHVNASFYLFQKNFVSVEPFYNAVIYPHVHCNFAAQMRQISFQCTVFKVVIIALCMLLAMHNVVLAQQLSDVKDKKAVETDEDAKIKDKPKKGFYKFRSNEKPLIWLDSVASDKRDTKKKVKKKRNVFFGYKARKAFTRKVSGGRITYELFYIMRKDTVPNPYIRDIYWYHRKKKKIFVGAIPKKDEEFAKLLHGPYKKTTNNIVEEEGMFMFGMKHGRWMYEKPVGDELVLQNKEYWEKGIPRDAQVSYYDAEKRKIEEIIPIQHGKKEGDYFLFYPSGNIKVEGAYEFDTKVGVWTEYFDTNPKKIHRRTQYPKTWTLYDFEPYVIIEYNEKGKVIYDKAAEDKKKAAQKAQN
jgi:antitoxin component YwqK of YwqJK toxin-antitoxin module